MGADTSPQLPLRSRLAVRVGRGVRRISQVSRLGSGSVIGGRAALRVDPQLLENLGRWRRNVLVSGTNGKTTTNHLLAAAMRTSAPVATNAEGANMAPGVVAALAGDLRAPLAALEVDERWLAQVAEAVGPSIVVLLNLSRDQLDRTQEVRLIAEGWRTVLGEVPTRAVVANADDPLVVWAARSAPSVVWVGTGMFWTLDATGCPACSGRIHFDDGTWACDRCDLARPDPDVYCDGDQVHFGDGSEVTLHLALPGRANRANATMVLAAAQLAGLDLERASAAMGTIDSVAGRYRVAQVGGRAVRMLLSKNPAGWQEALEMVGATDASAGSPGTPVVASINARIADGRDPSWLWDVPFEHLRGRHVVATGERRHDLAVRLAYAGVDHDMASDLADAVRHCPGDGPVDLIANYTAFQDYLDEVGREVER